MQQNSDFMTTMYSCQKGNPAEGDGYGSEWYGHVGFVLYQLSFIVNHWAKDHVIEL